MHKNINQIIINNYYALKFMNKLKHFFPPCSEKKRKKAKSKK
jgi:hypothetical protein